MTDEQKAAYINAQAAMLHVQMEGMIAANMEREHRGEAMAYGEEAFAQLSREYEMILGHNAVLLLFNQ